MTLKAEETKPVDGEEQKPKEEAQPKASLEDVMAKHGRGETLTPEEEEVAAGAGFEEPVIKDGDEGEEEEKEADPATGEEKPGAKKEPAAKEKEKPPVKTQTPEEAKKRRELIESELEKPDDKVDLSQYTPTEIGLYWSLKKERRRRQDAEGKNRGLRFEKTQEQLRKEREEHGEEETTEEDPFKDLDPDAVLTVEEIRERVAKTKKPAEKTKRPAFSYTREDVQREFADARLRLEQRGIKDFEDVMAYATVLTKEDGQIVAETVAAGGNGAEKSYWLIKGSPRWAEIEKAIADEKVKLNGTKEKEADPVNVARGKRAAGNLEKTRTTGGGGPTAAEMGEYSIEEILVMTPREFQKLPAKVQDKILQTYGSEPNFSK